MTVSGSSLGSYDAIQINDTAGLTYGGTFQVDFGSTLADNTTIDLFRFTGAASGTFANVTSTGAYGSLTFSKVDGVWTAQAGSQTISFAETTGDVIVVPEPAALAAVAGLAFGALVWRRRAAIG
jgi:hypothetical protein